MKPLSGDFELFVFRSIIKKMAKIQETATTFATISISLS